MSTTTELLRRRRLSQGLTLRGLADKCTAEGAAVHWTQIGRIERGLSVPNPGLRAVLAEILDLDVADFEKTAT